MVRLALLEVVLFMF